VVSSAIVVERQEDGHAYPVQRPVYFVSEVLSESKARYQPVQKLLYAVLITSRKLRHYFQEYPVSVITDYPLDDILRYQYATGRISKWAVELGTLNIDFKPRTTIKSQALVDFMAEWRENQLPTPTERPKHWVMYFAAHSNSKVPVQECSRSLQRANNSGTSCRSFGRSQTTKPSTKSYYTGSVSRLP
jgi:hypothetical protein